MSKKVLAALAAFTAFAVLILAGYYAFSWFMLCVFGLCR